jgi:hypothetical protein
VALPGSALVVSYLMYPQVESDGVRRDPLDPDAVKYTLTSKAA